MYLQSKIKSENYILDSYTIILSPFYLPPDPDHLFLTDPDPDRGGKK